MKKAIMVLSLVVILLLTFAPIFSSANESFIYDFYYEESIDNYVGTHNDVEIEWANNALHMVTLNGPADGGVGDTYFFLQNEEIEADTYYWAKIRIKNNSNATHFQIHYDAGAGIAATSNTLISISQGDTEFKEYVFNIKEMNLATSEWSQSSSRPFEIDESTWTGTVTSIRLDCMFKDFPGGQIDTDSKFDLEYIGFFKSEADAKAFSPDRSATPSPKPTEEPTSTPVKTPDVTTTATSKTTPSSTTSKGDSSFPIWILLIIIAVVVVVVVIVLVIIKRKGRK